MRCTLKRPVEDLEDSCGGFMPLVGDALPEEIRELALRGAQWVPVAVSSRLPRPPEPTQCPSFLSIPSPAVSSLRCRLRSATSIGLWLSRERVSSMQEGLWFTLGSGRSRLPAPPSSVHHSPQRAWSQLPASARSLPPAVPAQRVLASARGK